MVGRRMKDLIYSLDRDQANVIMLKYGFGEVDNLRIAHGFKPGQRLSDRHTALVLEMTERQIRALRTEALELLQERKNLIYANQ
jgi:hypothetical protein